MITAVFDPGVLIASVLSPRGTPASLLRRWDAGEFDLVVSAHVLEEFAAVLARPKFRRFVERASIDAMVGRLRRWGIVAVDPDEVEPVCRDPGDDYLVALGRSARASAIVSGDRDLLELSLVPPVVTPREFARLLDRR